MTDAISSSTAAVAAAATSSGASDSAITDAALADYDDFLTLLTTQLNNQDPLNPQDSTEFVAQIATFTTVEQQINANERLEELIAVTTERNVAQLASWVGMEVSAPGLAYSFDGAALSFDPLVDETAKSALALIKDADENVIAEISYDPKDATALVWDGAKSDGSEAEAGAYFIDFELTFVDEEGAETKQNYSSADFSRVVEARVIDGAQALILENGYVIQADQVNAVRQPGADVSSAMTSIVEAVTS